MSSVIEQPPSIDQPDDLPSKSLGPDVQKMLSAGGERYRSLLGTEVSLDNGCLTVRPSIHIVWREIFHAALERIDVSTSKDPSSDPITAVRFDLSDVQQIIPNAQRGIDELLARGIRVELVNASEHVRRDLAKMDMQNVQII